MKIKLKNPLLKLKMDQIQVSFKLKLSQKKLIFVTLDNPTTTINYNQQQ